MAGLLFGRCCFSIRWFIVVIPLISNVSGTRCDFCDRDFVVLGRHVWRCPARITGSAHPASNLPVQGAPDASFQGPVAAGVVPTHTEGSCLATDLTTCVCGRQCRGRRAWLRIKQHVVPTEISSKVII